MKKKVFNPVTNRDEKRDVLVNGYLIEDRYTSFYEHRIFRELLFNKFMYMYADIFTKTIDKSFDCKSFVRLKNIPLELRKLKINDFLNKDTIEYKSDESKFRVYCRSDIYLETGIKNKNDYQCIYIPVKALLEDDWNLIVERHSY